jgi:hypothetical protein
MKPGGFTIFHPRACILQAVKRKLEKGALAMAFGVDG